MQLNGRLLDLRGVDLHEQNIHTGAALTPAQLDALVGWAHELGATIIRAHYPLNPQIEQLADQDGILLWSEVPVYQSSTAYIRQTALARRAPTRFCARTSSTTRTTRRSCCGASATSCRRRPPTPRRATSPARLRSPISSTRPARSGWRSATGPASPARRPTRRSTSSASTTTSAGSTPAAARPTTRRAGSVPGQPPRLLSEQGADRHRVRVRGQPQRAGRGARHLPVPGRPPPSTTSGVFASKPYLSGAMWFALQTFAARPGWTGGDPLGDPPWVQKGEIDQYGNPTPLFALIQSIYGRRSQIAPLSAAQSKHSARIGCGDGRRDRSVRRSGSATASRSRESRRML